MIFGDIVGVKLPDICLTDEENLVKAHPGNLSRPGDRTRACYVTGTHAIACSTAVDEVHVGLQHIKTLCFREFRNQLKPEFPKAKAKMMLSALRLASFSCPSDL